jgi:hypothetical protein
MSRSPASKGDAEQSTADAKGFKLCFRIGHGPLRSGRLREVLILPGSPGNRRSQEVLFASWVVARGFVRWDANTGPKVRVFRAQT